MSDKQELIKKLLEMQKKFIDYDHEKGVEVVDYYVSDESHPLHDFSKKYMALANQLVDVAHEEKGSHR